MNVYANKPNLKQMSNVHKKKLYRTINWVYPKSESFIQHSEINQYYSP
jgi:hypothetical protein